MEEFEWFYLLPFAVLFFISLVVFTKISARRPYEWRGKFGKWFVIVPLCASVVISGSVFIHRSNLKKAAEARKYAIAERLFRTRKEFIVLFVDPGSSYILDETGPEISGAVRWLYTDPSSGDLKDSGFSVFSHAPDLQKMDNDSRTGLLKIRLPLVQLAISENFNDELPMDLGKADANGRILPQDDMGEWIETARRLALMKTNELLQIMKKEPDAIPGRRLKIDMLEAALSNPVMITHGVPGTKENPLGDLDKIINGRKYKVLTPTDQAKQF